MPDFLQRELPPVLKDNSTAAWERVEQSGLSHEELADCRKLVACSEFFARTLERYGDLLLTAYREPVAAENYRDTLSQRLSDCTNERDVKRQLRQFRHATMAALLWQEIKGSLSLADSLRHYSELADACITSALEWLTESFSERYGKALSESGDEQPLVVLGMGKLGGRELNFSSDIDLIFFYPHQGETSGGRRSVENSVYYTKLAQALIAALDEQTADGQVFRVDMRLRPFGSSGPLVASMTALEHYYQEQGRDWERYAMVKARVINSQETIAAEFYRMIRPFVYRRYIDFSSIESLRKMKLLITQETRRQGLKHNIKLGAGGIREVEFIAQTHQLIRGGQQKVLQTQSLYRAFEEAEELELLPSETVAELIKDYEFLRVIEHRLQQLNDEQTQTLPGEALAQQQLCYLLGYKDWSQLNDEIADVMTRIHNEFEQVIGSQSEDDEEEQGLQVLWQDMLEDDAALEILATETDADSEQLWQQIKSFRSEARKRSSGPRGRSALARLMPLLLRQILKQQHPVELLDRVLSVVRAIMSRTAYLDLLAENIGAREQLCKLCAASPWISRQLAAHPVLLDELIDPQQLYELADVEQYPALLRDYLVRIPEQDMERQMDALRQAKQALQLKIAAADISGALELMKVSDHLSYLAQAVIAEVVSMAWSQLTKKHGHPPGRTLDNSGFAVLAYGKLGGLELGYGSDLDLVFLTDADYSGKTDGDKPIGVQQFYLRLAQRVLHLFTTRTVAGVLYEVDLRLRPSGQSGLLVSRVESFIRYLREDAWTWELQALVRARCVYGNAQLCAQLEDIRQAMLCRQRDKEQLREDVLTMRKKMREHLASEGEGFDLKQDPGGIADIEFITQYLVLAHSHQHETLCQYSDNIRILTVAEQLQLMSEVDTQNLINAYQILRCESHSLALQGQNKLVQHDLDNERQAVIDCWKRLFKL
ncbi:bifunctional [glutamate--ammonia ligase]-adenylyl-L-tyrosine phosphorylase/[glutamate--ammonia-ligase] adenylyltransferase [Idiomarina seosinensis]|uniref:bifunctional [glutamate--ammonia ligase]-adenylyl-L-tyrosine phosphorylase/[glutamate--ammonia-ligase] adenylyltransferase n=1 Tax=Idiomarina seosinensis TaxID=281739 RepID=UPI00384AFE2C